MDISEIHPALLVWSIVSLPVSGLSFLITYPNPISMFHLFLMTMNFAGLIVLISGMFHDVAEASEDWNPNPDSESITTWTLIGLTLVFLTPMFFSMTLIKQDISSMIPQQLYPLQTSPILIYTFMTDLFGTWFSVVPGEENMKIAFAPLQKAFGDLNLPFALQPAILMGSAVWAIEHVIKGSSPLFFALSVFITAIAMDFATAQSGTLLTRWLIHASFNTILLFSTLIGMGVISVG